jgi:hypothetical protein
MVFGVPYSRRARVLFRHFGESLSPRHPGVGRDPVPFFHSGETSHSVIPAEAGIHLFLFFDFRR